MALTLEEVRESVAQQMTNSAWYNYPEESCLEPSKDLCHVVTGLNGEAGEVAELLKKEIFRGKKKTKDEWASELGDVLWYLMAVATIKDINIEYIWHLNCAKLEERRKNGMKGKDTWEG